MGRNKSFCEFSSKIDRKTFTQHRKRRKKHSNWKPQIRWLKKKNNIYFRRRSNHLTPNFLKGFFFWWLTWQNNRLVSFTWCVCSLTTLIQIRCLIGEGIRARCWWHCKYWHVWSGLTCIGLRCYGIVTFMEFILSQLNKIFVKIASKFLTKKSE